MSWAPDPFADTGGATRAPLAARRAQCAASYGPPRDAGARLAPDTLQRAQALGLSLNAYQQRNDAYGFFSALGDLVVTGPTHTNVNDFRAILVL
jgi:glycerate-2-kinase